MGRRVVARARRIHLAGVREHFLGRCTDDEPATMVTVWERLPPGCTA